MNHHIFIPCGCDPKQLCADSSQISRLYQAADMSYKSNGLCDNHFFRFCHLYLLETHSCEKIFNLLKSCCSIFFTLHFWLNTLCCYEIYGICLPHLLIIYSAAAAMNINLKVPFCVHRSHNSARIWYFAAFQGKRVHSSCSSLRWWSIQPSRVVSCFSRSLMRVKHWQLKNGLLLQIYYYIR